MFYRDVRTGRLQRPLPIDAVGNVVCTIKTHTPTIFDSSVARAIDESSQSTPKAAEIETEANSQELILPPPDPLTELDPQKAQDFQVAGVINKLWQVFVAGEKIRAAEKAWIETFNSLSPSMITVLDWLKEFLGLK